MNQHSKITQDLYLTRYTVPKAQAAVAKPEAVNRIMVLDVSGSMWNELPAMRKHLKDNLVRCAGPGDTVSIIWFSGRGQYGVLLEASPVGTLGELGEVHKAIDRWLQPVGLTGFKEPLEEVAKLQNRVAAKTGNPLCSLFFLSDGHDNQWPRYEVLAVAQGLRLNAVTIVEYGYYADRAFLAKLAEMMGGQHIFAENFTEYEPVVEAALAGRPSAPRHEIALHAAPIGGFAFSMANGELVAYAVTLGHTVHVPADIEQVYYLAPTAPLPWRTMDDDIAALYAALSLFATRMQPDVIWPILKNLGDVALIDQYARCFGKQRYSAFQAAAKAAAFDPTQRLLAGYDPTKVPQEDAFTLIDFLKLLNENDRLLLDHPAFVYKRISRGRVDAASQLSEEETTEIEALAAAIKASRSPAELAKMGDRLATILMAKKPPLKFVANDEPDGYKVDGLVIPEGRANVSVRVLKTGFVDLSSRLDEIEGLGIPTRFPTIGFRTYALAKDGLNNVDVLPTRLSEATRQVLMDEIVAGRLSGQALDFVEDGIIMVHLDQFPMTNRRNTKAPSAAVMFDLEYQLLQAQARAKVLNFYKKERFPKVAMGLAQQYGGDAAEWLKGVGITDGGFNPKTEGAEVSDVYMAKELKTGIKGLSSLPSVNDVRKQLEKGGKLTPGAALMAPALAEYDAYLASPAYTSFPEPDRMLEAWLDGEARKATLETRRLILQLAEIKFSVIVGGVWFVEFASLDEGTIALDLGTGQPLVCTVTQREIEVEI